LRPRCEAIDKSIFRKSFIVFVRLKEYLELSRGDVSNLRPMEGLRGFAVFLVLLVHYATLAEPWVNSAILLQFSGALHELGGSGVDLFFVLSGYLIYGSLISRPQRFSLFVKRRVVRIYPVFLVIFAIYVFLSALFPAENKIPDTLWGGFVYLLANLLLLPGLFPIQPMITVAWSLSYEMFCYVLIPMLIRVLHLRRRPSLWRVVLFVVIGLTLVFYCLNYGGPIRLIMFICGILLFESLSKAVHVQISDSFAFVLFLLSMRCLLFSGPTNDVEIVKALILFLAFFVICYVCFQTRRETGASPAAPGCDLPGIFSTRSYLRAAPGLVDVACCRWNSTGVMYCRLECGRTSL
jgi:exopolysaccharide production protein ExoZ